MHGSVETLIIVGYNLERLQSTPLISKQIYPKVQGLEVP